MVEPKEKFEIGEHIPVDEPQHPDDILMLDDPELAALHGQYVAWGELLQATREARRDFAIGHLTFALQEMGHLITIGKAEELLDQVLDILNNQARMCRAWCPTILNRSTSPRH